jgi:hypothetical protein
VHGFRGHPEHTWTARNGVFWPVDLLPASMGSVGARVMTYGYDTAATFMVSGPHGIDAAARGLLDALAAKRCVRFIPMLLPMAGLFGSTSSICPVRPVRIAFRRLRSSCWFTNLSDEVAM